MSAEPTSSDLYGVVMAGGSGLRFWPASRAHKPKQLLAISSDRPLVLEALERLSPVVGPLTAGRHYLVAGQQHREALLASCPSLDERQLLIEPCARNTAPCVALAALHIAQRDPNAVMVISPADHHVAYQEAFTHAILRAAEGARLGALVTLGVSPTRPETGYGYIELQGPVEGGGEPLTPSGGGQVMGRQRVARFVEKPSLEVAQRYVDSGRYLWNSGVFVMRVDRLFEELQRQLPQHWEALMRIKASLGSAHYEQVLSEQFSLMRSMSLDYGVMEGAAQVEVVPVSLGWSDVGHWAALQELYPADEQGNVKVGEGHLCLDAQRNVIYSAGQGAPQVSLLGVEGLVVAYSPDALLVCKVEDSQRVREVVEALRARGDEGLL